VCPVYLGIPLLRAIRGKRYCTGQYGTVRKRLSSLTTQRIA